MYFSVGGAKNNPTLAEQRGSRNNEQPDWFNLELWGKTAEVAANYGRKGSLIGVQGALKIETWSDRTTGAKRSKPVIKVDRMDLLGSKRDTDTSAVDGYNNTEF